MCPVYAGVHAAKVVKFMAIRKVRYLMCKTPAYAVRGVEFSLVFKMPIPILTYATHPQETAGLFVTLDARPEA
jgi:hypothetical protein